MRQSGMTLTIDCWQWKWHGKIFAGFHQASRKWASEKFDLGTCCLFEGSSSVAGGLPHHSIRIEVMFLCQKSLRPLVSGSGHKIAMAHPQRESLASLAINSTVKLKLKMRKVYAPFAGRQVRSLPEEQFQFLCVFYMPTVNCRPSCLLAQSSKARGSQMLPPFLSCHFGVYSRTSPRKFHVHVRNRHKSYGHILNLCAPRLP